MIPVDDVITLVSCTKQRDDYGVEREIVSTRDVMAQVHSVTRQEFFDAGRNGLNPSFVFTVFAGDYNDEEECRYNGKQYTIYRTYISHGDVRTHVSNTSKGTAVRSYHTPSDDYIELYVERKGGSNRIPVEDNGTQENHD